MMSEKLNMEKYKALAMQAREMCATHKGIVIGAAAAILGVAGAIVTTCAVRRNNRMVMSDDRLESSIQYLDGELREIRAYWKRGGTYMLVLDSITQCEPVGDMITILRVNEEAFNACGADKCIGTRIFVYDDCNRFDIVPVDACSGDDLDE